MNSGYISEKNTRYLNRAFFETSLLSCLIAGALSSAIVLHRRPSLKKKRR